MTPVCIDSDILIDYLRGLDSARDFLTENTAANLYVSCISVAEIYSGKDVARISVQQELSAFFDNFSLIPITPEIAKLSGEIRRDGNRPFADAMIAASAIFYNLPLATRNKKHFRGIKNLQLVTPY